MRIITLIFLIRISLVCNAQVTPVFTVSIATTPSGCVKGSAKITVNGGSGPLSVTWNNGQAGTMVYGLDAGIYQVEIKDTIINDTVVNVYIDSLICALQGENTFSPNGDGINDTWEVSNVSLYDNYLIQVYTRWGQKVFESKSDFKPWDGTNVGLPVPDGTYYFIIEFEDKYYGIQNKHGSITLLR
ncbi:MAG: gliding motility-associated C-terminal domain-containing protein [Bacteroidota bacterium]|jgi:gliding motility-associated-like protein